MGIELVRNEKKTPLPMNLAESIVRRAFEAGLVLLPGHGLQKEGGPSNSRSPVIVREEEIDPIYGILEPLIRNAANRYDKSQGSDAGIIFFGSEAENE
jgi:4-aminobutyrate aminotransferase-like enzyme